MKLSTIFLSIFIILTGVFFINKSLTSKIFYDSDKGSDKELMSEDEEPCDWLFMQRSYPYGNIDSRAYLKALDFIKKQKADSDNRNQIYAQPWEFCGPDNIGGRVTDIEMSDDLNTIYVAAASGGIFKSVDDGHLWTPLFDNELILSIGDIALAPNDNKIIYVGTGEANAGGGSIAYDGNGMYKSLNGGATWTQIGLENVGSIGKVVIHPKNSEICFTAAMGYLFENNNDRGLYRTTNGGVNWEKVLFINDSTGVIDVAINPLHPDTIFAASWERVRRVDRRSYGGPSSGIYRSKNGGDTWQKLTNGLPASAGRIGIAIAASNPAILYAFYTDATTGYLDNIYKSIDNGNSWFALDPINMIGAPYMWWFGKIFTDPNNASVVYATGFYMYKSTDGGNNWNEIFSGSHVDQHSICVKPNNSNKVLLGNDGGAYLSMDGGDSFDKLNRLPITQFYTCDIDYKSPRRFYGGAQDNGIVRTLTGNINAWQEIELGDGFRVLVDPSDHNFVYAEIQYGALKRSTNGGASFSSATSGISSQDRKNWNSPLILNPLNPSILYFGTHRLYKSTNRAVSWTVISPDLTSHKVNNEIIYGTITTIAVSPVNDNIIYTGTDDGNVHVTLNGGSSWTSVSSALPDRWVTSVVADPDDENTAFVTLSGFRYGEPIGHIYKTTNLGTTWSDISGDLPDIPVNDLIVTPQYGILFIATDIGVLYSENHGMNWKLLGTGLPNIVCTDLSFYLPDNLLLVATFGRGMFKINLDDINVSTSDVGQENFQLRAIPNPFDDKTIIECYIANSMKYSISIFNVSGIFVKTICDQSLEKGMHYIPVDAVQLPEGLYLCKISSADGRISETIQLIKI